MIVWIFVACHIWRIVPTVYEAYYGRGVNLPVWLHYVIMVSHLFIVVNSTLNFLIYLIV